MDDQNQNKQPSDQGSVPVDPIVSNVPLDITPQTAPPDMTPPVVPSEPVSAPSGAVPVNMVVPDVPPIPFPTPQIETNQPLPETPVENELPMPKPKHKIKITPIIGGVVALLLVVGMAGAAYYVSDQLSTRQAIAPNAPESKPMACTDTCEWSCALNKAIVDECDPPETKCVDGKVDNCLAYSAYCPNTGYWRLSTVDCGGGGGGATACTRDTGSGGENSCYKTRPNSTPGTCTTNPWRYECGTECCNTSFGGNDGIVCCGTGCYPKGTTCPTCPAEKDCPTTCHTDTKKVSDGKCGEKSCVPNAPAAGTCPTCRKVASTVPDGQCGNTTCAINCTTACRSDVCCAAAQTCPTTCHANTIKVPNGTCGETSCPSNAPAAGTCPTACNYAGGTVPNGQCGTTTCPAGSCPSGKTCNASSGTCEGCPAAGTCPTACNYAGGTVPNGQCGTTTCPAGSCPSGKTCNASGTCVGCPAAGTCPTACGYEGGTVPNGTCGQKTCEATEECPPEVPGACMLINIYKKVSSTDPGNPVYETTSMTATQLNTLKVGDVLRFSLTANKAGLRGRFRVTANSTPGGWLSGIPGSNDKEIISGDYTVQVAGTYKFEAQIGYTPTVTPTCTSISADHEIINLTVGQSQTVTFVPNGPVDHFSTSASSAYNVIPTDLVYNPPYTWTITGVEVGSSEFVVNGHGADNYIMPSCIKRIPVNIQ